jgi:hypothetical protein
VIRSAVLADRPYALWYLFSFLHLYAFVRVKKAPSISLAMLGFLLAFTSMIAPVQALASSLVRGYQLRKDRRQAATALLEALPSVLTGLWYWSHSHNMPYASSFTAPFADLWLEALIKGTWSAGDSFFSAERSLNASWQGMPLLALLCCPVILLLPLLLPGSFRRAQTYGITLLLLSFPVTIGAWFVAQSLQPRYFMYLYPVLGMSHVYAVLTAASWVKNKSGKLKAGIAVLAIWCMAQSAFRLPVMVSDISIARAAEGFPLYVAEPLSGCPESFGAYRRGISRVISLGAIDLQKLQAACLPKAYSRVLRISFMSDTGLPRDPFSESATKTVSSPAIEPR